MSLISFPENPDQRQSILFLDRKTILEIGNNSDNAVGLKILEDPSILIVPYPVSDLAKRRSPILNALIDVHDGSNKMIMLDVENSHLSNVSYVSIDEKMQGFIEKNIKLAHSYSSFFAALGATRIFIETAQNQHETINFEAQASMDGALKNVANSDFCFSQDVKNKISEFLKFENIYEKKLIKHDNDSWLIEAEDIMFKEGLQNDVCCISTLNDFKRGNKKSYMEISTNSSRETISQMNAVIEFGLNIPQLATLAKIKVKIENLNSIMSICNKKLIVQWGDQ